MGVAKVFRCTLNQQIACSYGFSEKRYGDIRSMSRDLKKKLESLLGNDARLLDGAFEREVYSMDIGAIPFTGLLFDNIPEMIIQPKKIEALKTIIRVANEERVAIFPRGSGSSGLGGVVPTVGGMVIDFSSLNEIDELDQEKMTIIVQAGVRWSEIENFLKSKELTMRTYPSSFFSTIGGWIATGGYGIGSFKFGNIQSQIESIEVLFPSGEIKSINQDDEEFSLFFGTEGQFGIVLTATLKLRNKPRKALPHMIYFDSAEAAVNFIKDMIKENIVPYNIKYMDAAHIGETNKILGERSFREKDSVLVTFEDELEDRKFLSFASNRGIHAEEYLAHYIWHERLFSMKRKGSKPTPLACELTIPLENFSPYLKKIIRMSKRFKVKINVESYIIGKDEALVLIHYDSDVRNFRTYLAHLALIPVLTKIGIAFRGVPYGLGIWNAPFINEKIDHQTLRRYKAYKHEVDPRNILNPGKFFTARTKWANIPGILLKPVVFRTITKIAPMFSPILLSPILEEKSTKDETELEKTVYSCVKCGSCASVCPAYLITRDELLNPKNKMHLAKKLLLGETITKSDAEKAFLCLHCGMCREVCQNDLDLLTAWLELEEGLEHIFDKPEDAIQNFVSSIEASEEYWRFVYAQKV
ncbi:MAG: FAD-binding protein [Methanocellales archaeon]|nr:FAD-binding protein [Methanocellales archaeon]